MADQPAQPASPPPRLVPRDSSRPAIRRLGIRRSSWSDLYHFLLTTSWPRLIGLIVALYLVTNLMFAVLYLLGGDTIENARTGSFEDAFFFSVQTMATIGYGKMVPRGAYANALVTLEALTGMLYLAMATGLIFAKFSRPTARVMWSRVAVVAPRDGVPHLMFRLANQRGNQIVEATMRAVMSHNEVTREGERIRRFLNVELVRDRITFFALTWTVMHKIDEKSPLWGETVESLEAHGSELILSVMGLDDTFAQTVNARHSYLPSEIRWGHRLVDIIDLRPDGAVIDYTRFDETQPVDETAEPASAPATQANQ
jgi:inward rectifier potassium channel